MHIDWKGLFDIAAISTAWATIAKALPPTAALFSILWIGYQFYREFRGRR